MTDEMERELNRILAEDESNDNRIEVLQQQIVALSSQVQQMAEANTRQTNGQESSSASAPHRESMAPNQETFRHAFQLLQRGDVDTDGLPQVAFDAVQAAEGIQTIPKSRIEYRKTQSHRLQNEDAVRMQPPPQAQPTPPRDNQHQGVFLSTDDINSQVDYGVGATLAAMALPDVKNFNNPEGKGFSKFVTSFTMKYGRIGLSDDMLIHLMSEKLEGHPKAVMKTLPSDVRTGRFQDFVDALATKFAENNPAKRMESHVKLKQLKMNRTVAEYCVELEELTRDVKPDASDTDLSVIRASELITQLTQWPEYFQLFAAMENAHPYEVYENLKNLALGIERSKRVAAAVRAASDNRKSNDINKPRTFHFRKTKERVIETTKNEASTEIKDGNAPQPNSVAAPSKTQEQTGPKVCLNCGKPGHFRRDCRYGINRRTEEVNMPNKAAPIPKNNFSNTLQTWSCHTIDVHEAKNEVYGEKPMCKVNLLGITTNALIDTGSQVSMLPLQLLLRALNSGFDIDADVEEVQLQQNTIIYDASGNIMSFKGAVRLTLKTLEGPQRKVVFLVKKGGDEMVVLGTNIPQAIGINISIQTDSTTRTKQTVATQTIPPSSKTRCFTKNDNKSQNVQPATVLRRVYIKPGETKNLPIHAKKSTTDQVMWSCCNMIPHAVHSVNKVVVEIPVTNMTQEPKIFKVGDKVGEWDQGPIVEKPLPGHASMLERTTVPDPNRWETLTRTLAVNRREKQMEENLRQTIAKFQDVFAVSEQELTQTPLVEHTIETGESPPIRQKARPIPLATRVELRKILTDLQDRNIIEPSKSAWSSPIVLVQKKDGSLRLSVDYRKINRVTQIDSYPLPTVDTILQNLKGKRYFSTLDLSSGYWQVKLSDSTKEKSTFVTTEGLYQFKVLPFGLASSPAVFQRLMHMVLGPLLGDEVSCYLDDIIVATPTAERHFERLSQVLSRLREANLKLNPKKCILMEAQVEFLGHVLDKDGLKADPKKVSAIKNYPPPKNRSEMRTFLGMCSYYRKFILKFSKIAAPLHEMTSEKAPFEWSVERTTAFETLKSALTSTPVLAQPDIEAARSGSRPFCIHTDASREGLGAVLSQKGEDNFLHPIFFASKGLTKTERQYHITDLEALAVLMALRRFHMFVYGLPVEVYTDHQPLTALFTRTNVSQRILRWSLELQKYNMKIIYLKGAANRVADALSRGAVDPMNVEETKNIPNELIVANTSEEPEWTTELRKHPVYGKVITDLEKESLSEDVVLGNTARKLKVADFVMEDGYLCLLDKHNTRKIVPPSSRRKVFDDAHSALLAGHFGPKKLMRTLSKRVFWETMARDVKIWSEECKKCTIFNQQRRMTPPLKPIITSEPFEMIGIDILEVGPTSEGNRYILSVVDHFTKFGGAYPIPSKTAETVARVLFERWMADGCRIPKCILCDQGGEFDNKLMAKLSELMGIEQAFTKGYNPRENGVTERFNKTILGLLRKKVAVPTEWDKLLPHCVFAYNTSVHETTGESPFFLLHGFDANVPWNTLPKFQVTPYMMDIEEYVHELVTGLKLAHQHVKEQNEKMRNAMKKNYDKTHGVIEKPLKIGDRVYMRIPTEKAKSTHPKLANEWSGPYRIVDLSDNSATITEINGKSDPLRIPFDELRKVPRGIDDEPITTLRNRNKRVAIGDPREDPLHLYYPCQCGIFNTRAQVGLPGLRCDLARSKPVKNLFELAHVASIALHPYWGDERKEHELLDDSSRYLTIHGLACAIQAHKKFCYAFATALKAKEGVELSHPPLFTTNPGYDIEMYYRQAMARRTQITSQYSDDMPHNPVLIALPKSFARVLKEVNEPATVKFVVYSHFGDLADQLNKHCITAALVWVWPNEMPCSQHMVMVQNAIERHLQCGGTLEMLPPPFEASREQEWRRIASVCREVAEFLTGPERGFDARIADYYSTIDDVVPIKHPAISLGVNPRKGEDRLISWQIVTYLNQVGQTVSNTLVLPTFSLSRQHQSNEKNEINRQSTSKEVPAAYKDAKRKPDIYYIKNVKGKHEETAHLMKQKRRRFH